MSSSNGTTTLAPTNSYDSAAIQKRAETRRWNIVNKAQRYYQMYLKDKDSIGNNELHELQGLYVDYSLAPQADEKYDDQMYNIMRHFFGTDWEPYEPGNHTGGRLKLFDAKGEPKPFKKMRAPRIKAVFKKDARFQQLIDWISEEGPAFSKFAFMLGTAFETGYAGWMAGKPESVTAMASLVGGNAAQVGAGGQVWLVSCIVWGVGLMFETAFAHAWVMSGSGKLASEQVEINDEIFNKCRFIMAGGLIAALVSTLFGMQMIMNAYLAFMAAGAIHIIGLQRDLKLAHPAVAARQKQSDLKAEWEAAWVHESGKEQKHYLKQTAQERTIEAKEQEIKHTEEIKVLDSKAYRRQVEEEAKNRFLTVGKGGGGLSGGIINIINEAKRLMGPRNN